MIDEACEERIYGFDKDQSKAQSDQIHKGIANKHILDSLNKNIDKIYVKVSAAFGKQFDSIDAGPHLVMPQGIKIELLNSSRLTVHGIYREKRNNSPIIELTIMEKKDDTLQLVETCMVAEWENADAPYKYVRLKYLDFIVLIVEGIDEFDETKICYYSNYLKSY
ncbi:MAG: hypothetical protein AMXMBFR12_02890 [Candidatus Babeliales bacterium]